MGIPVKDMRVSNLHHETALKLFDYQTNIIFYKIINMSLITLRPPLKTHLYIEVYLFSHTIKTNFLQNIFYFCSNKNILVIHK